MYNTSTTMENSQGYVIEELTKDEVNKLKKLTIGYGMLRRFSREVGMHENTIRGVILRESGKPETIKIIREKLAGASNIQSEKV